MNESAIVIIVVPFGLLVTRNTLLVGLLFQKTYRSRLKYETIALNAIR